MPQTLRAALPDLEVRAFLRFLKLSGQQRPLENLSVRQLRLVWRLSSLANGRRLAVGTVRERTIEGPGGPIRMRIYAPSPSGQALPALLWCHGGGFMLGGLDAADAICRNIAQVAGCKVVAVSYRLAPEHSLQAGREDVLAALDWLTLHGTDVGIDSQRLAIGGDSAGGNIAAAVAQVGVRPGGRALRLQVLAYPATELVDDFPSKTENAKGYMVTKALLDHMKRIAIPVSGADDPWLSPRRLPDLRGLPPALVISAGYDPIRDDALDYAARLRAAAVPVELLHYAGQIHGFLNLDAVLNGGRDVLQRIGEALAAAFRGEAAPNRTLEIVDHGGDSRHSAITPGLEATATMVIAMVSAERWCETLLRQALPRLTDAYARQLRFWFAPAYCVRHRVASRLGRLVAHQTFPRSTA